VLGLPGAEGVGVLSLIEFLSVESKSSRASLYRGQKGRRLNCAGFTTRITLLTSFNKRVDNRTTFRLSPLTIRRLNPIVNGTVTPLWMWVQKVIHLIRKKNDRHRRTY
jgi:hypothetical protein